MWENGEGKIDPQARRCPHILQTSCEGGLSRVLSRVAGVQRDLSLRIKKVAARNADSSGLKAPRGRRSPACSNWETRGGSGGHLAWFAGRLSGVMGAGNRAPPRRKCPKHPPSRSPAFGAPQQGGGGGVFLSIGVWPVAGVGCRGPQEPPEATQLGVGLRRNARGARMRVGLARAEPQERASRGGPTKSPTPRVYSPPVRGPRHFQGLAGSRPGTGTQMSLWVGEAGSGQARRSKIERVVLTVFGALGGVPAENKVSEAAQIRSSLPMASEKRISCVSSAV